MLKMTNTDRAAVVADWERMAPVAFYTACSNLPEGITATDVKLGRQTAYRMLWPEFYKEVNTTEYRCET